MQAGQEVIVDGYNLLRTDPELAMFESLGLEIAREVVVKRLLSASGLKKIPLITLVFDGHKGGQSYEKQERRANGRLVIIYSKLGESADEVIKRLVRERANQPVPPRVITRDWEIKDAASQSGATSGVMKRRVSVERARSSRGEEEEESTYWKGTTNKKGPAKRSKKGKRNPAHEDDVYW